jgi:hypothetical protein
MPSEVTGLIEKRTPDAARNTGESPTKIAAHISNTPSGHTVEVETEVRKQSIGIVPTSAGEAPV